MKKNKSEVKAEVKEIKLPDLVLANAGKEEVVYKVAKHHAIVDKKPGFFDRKARSEWNARQKLIENSPDKIVLIKMEMSNGFFREFLVEEEAESFYYKKNMYVLDAELKYYIIERNIWAYDFHENLSLPIRKKIRISDDVQVVLDMLEAASRKGIKPQIPVNDIKKIIENSGFVDVENSLNPTTLKRFTDSEVIKQVLQGAMLGKIFKIMFVLIIIIAIFALLNLVINLYASGVFEGLKEMFNKS